MILSEVHGAPNKEIKDDAHASTREAEVTGLKCTGVRGGMACHRSASLDMKRASVWI